jgi:hypothetical protein
MVPAMQCKMARSCSSAGGVSGHAVIAPPVYQSVLGVCRLVACSGRCWRLQLGLRPRHTHHGAGTQRLGVLGASISSGGSALYFAYIIRTCSVIQLYVSLSAVLSAFAVIFHQPQPGKLAAASLMCIKCVRTLHE